MVLCNIECVKRIAKYLDVSAGKLEISDENIVISCRNENEPILQGFATIVLALLRNSKYCDVLTNDKEVEALAQQWLEYILICVNHADVSSNTKRILDELNTTLKSVPYITGTTKTIADVALYYVLYSVMKESNLQEKARYVHLSRWFDNMQQEENLRRELALISFNVTHLFL